MGWAISHLSYGLPKHLFCTIEPSDTRECMIGNISYFQNYKQYLQYVDFIPQQILGVRIQADCLNPHFDFQCTN